MPKYYKKINGWFNFENIYDIVTHKYNHAKFVEVGCWLGKSTCYMAELIKEKNKDIKFYAVDTWEGSKEEYHKQFIKELGSITLYEIFINNMQNAGVIEYVEPIKKLSIEAAKLFEDQSLDFVFIDASHEYEDVRQDIQAWLPTVKKGGIIAGHDYCESNPPAAGVVRAVKETFGTDYEVRRDCWIKEIK